MAGTQYWLPFLVLAVLATPSLANYGGVSAPIGAAVLVSGSPGPAGPSACGSHLEGTVACVRSPAPGAVAPNSAGTALGQWTRASANPPSSVGAAMAYDQTDGYTVLFGGAGNGFFPPNTTWIYRNSSWTPLELNPSPSARDAAAMVFDGHAGYLVLFGGRTTGTYYYLNDTWTFVHGHWTQLSPRHSPSPRYGPAMTYDVVDRYVLLYSGSTTATHDTWKFAGGQWTNITNYPGNSGPPWSKRYYTYTQLAYDSADQYAVLYAAEIGAWAATWTFKAGNWTNMTAAAGPPPAPRAQEAFADDPLDGYALLVGGGNYSQTFNDTHAFVNGSWKLLSTRGAFPPQYGSAMTYDHSARMMILHPGGTGSYAGVYLRPATWSYGHRTWTALSPPPPVSPPPRSDAALASIGGAALLFGGRGANGTVLGDTWIDVGGFWFNITTKVGTAPAARYGAMFNVGWVGAYLFGGTNGSAVFADTWRFLTNGGGGFPSPGHWVPVRGFTRSPPARFDAASTYNVVTHQTILFGGRNATSFLNDTWAWTQKGGWVPASVGIAPPARSAAGLAYTRSSLVDPGNLTLFGGVNSTSILSDLWVLHLGNWTRVPVTGSSPLPVAGTALGETPNHPFGRQAGRFQSRPTIVMGGENGSSFSNLTWRLILTHWVLARTALTPDARAFGSETFVSDWTGREGVLLFGGEGPTGLLSDTWLYLMA